MTFAAAETAHADSCVARHFEVADCNGKQRQVAVFKADGTGTFSFPDCSRRCEPTVTSFTWIAIGGKLHVEYLETKRCGTLTPAKVNVKLPYTCDATKLVFNDVTWLASTPMPAPKAPAPSPPPTTPPPASPAPPSAKPQIPPAAAAPPAARPRPPAAVPPARPKARPAPSPRPAPAPKSNDPLLAEKSRLPPLASMRDPSRAARRKLLAKQAATARAARPVTAPAATAPRPAPGGSAARYSGKVGLVVVAPKRDRAQIVAAARNAVAAAGGTPTAQSRVDAALDHLAAGWRTARFGSVDAIRGVLGLDLLVIISSKATSPTGPLSAMVYTSPRSGAPQFASWSRAGLKAAVEAAVGAVLPRSSATGPVVSAPRRRTLAVKRGGQPVRATLTTRRRTLAARPSTAAGATAAPTRRSLPSRRSLAARPGRSRGAAHEATNRVGRTSGKRGGKGVGFSTGVRLKSDVIRRAWVQRGGLIGSTHVGASYVGIFPEAEGANSLNGFGFTLGQSFLILSPPVYGKKSSFFAVKFGAGLDFQAMFTGSGGGGDAPSELTSLSPSYSGGSGGGAGGSDDPMTSLTVPFEFGLMLGGGSFVVDNRWRGVVLGLYYRPSLTIPTDDNQEASFNEKGFSFTLDFSTLEAAVGKLAKKAQLRIFGFFLPPIDDFNAWVVSLGFGATWY